MSQFLWQQESNFQFGPRGAVDRLQEAHLLEYVNYCMQKSPFYANHFGKSVSQVTSLADFHQLEFTTKDDLLKHNPEFLAVPEVEIVDTCFTSATVGTTPVNFLLTKSDLARLVHNERVAFEIAGITREDTVAVCVALERGFMAGLAYFLGGVELGAHMIRIGASGAQHIWDLLKNHRPTAIIGVPSVLANIAIQALEAGENPATLKLERIMAIGESTRDKQLNQLAAIQRIEQMWEAPIYSTYASTEMATSFAECRERRGGHCRPEMIYVEIIDDQGHMVKDGEIGEVVVTPLGVEGMPLLRFKTGDMSYIINEQCACGRTTRRIGPVIGRKAQLLKYKGTNVFPNAIVSIVEANPDFLGCYVEAYEGRFGEDRVVAVLAPANQHYDLDKLKEEFRAGLRVVPELRLIDEAEFQTKTQPAGKRKRQIFFDMREGTTF
jgi:phenylacetate-CoA ligase